MIQCDVFFSLAEIIRTLSNTQSTKRKRKRTHHDLINSEKNSSTQSEHNYLDMNPNSALPILEAQISSHIQIQLETKDSLQPIRPQLGKQHSSNYLKSFFFISFSNELGINGQQALVCSKYLK